MIFDILKYIFLETESANEILSRERDVIRKSFVKVPDELTNLRYAMYASKQLNKLVDLFFLLDGELYLSMLNKLKKELLSDDSFNQLLLELSFSSYYGTELDTDREFMKKFFLYRVISLRVKYLNGKLPFIKKNLYSQSLFLQYRKLHKDYSREMKSNYTI
jgi:hypothetical protein